jgi:hypothetical protein
MGYMPNQNTHAQILKDLNLENIQNNHSPSNTLFCQNYTTLSFLFYYVEYKACSSILLQKFINDHCFMLTGNLL